MTAVELMPVHHFVARPPPGRAGPHQLLGLQLDRLLRPARRVRDRRPRPAGERVQVDGPGRCTAPASRSSWTWSTTTPARATTSGRPCRCGASTTPSYYRLVPDDPRYYLDFTGDRQQPQHRASPHDGADHRQPALLGDRHARRRVPLRPRPGPRPRATRPASRARSSRSSSRTRCSRTVKLIAEPWDAGPDGYQLGQVPARLVRVERRLPRLRPAVLAGRRRPGTRARLPAHRVERHLRPERPAHLRQHQLRHLPRRLHPDRPRQLRPQAQRGQRRRQPRTGPTRTSAATGASRARPTRCGPSGCATG